MPGMMVWFLRLYPLALGVIAVGGIVASELYSAHAARLRKRGPSNTDTAPSLQHALASIPQIAACVLLLVYAATFHRRNSAWAHLLLVESCLHQSLLSLLMASTVYMISHTTLSICCVSPRLCPVDVEDCQLGAIFQCHETDALDVWPRLAQMATTSVVLAAMTSISAVQRVKHLQSRVHRAQFVAFDRHGPLHASSAAVR